jgi:hypothetical protein
MEILPKDYTIALKVRDMRISMNHNSLGCEQPSGLDVKQSPDAQEAWIVPHSLLNALGFF